MTFLLDRSLETIKTSEENNITLEETGIIETSEVKCVTSIVLLPSTFFSS
jgi:hypothetical protein